MNKIDEIKQQITKEINETYDFEFDTVIQLVLNLKNEIEQEQERISEY